MKESNKKRKERLASAYASLAALYPDAKPALEFSSPFELLMATMLSAQCTDVQVNKTTRVLFAKYNTPEAIAALEVAELEGYIKGCGLYKTKAKNMIATSKLIVENYAGEVPRERDTLMTFPGVGRKTANVVVSNAFGVNAIAVDTHVFRVANRIGFADAKDVLNTELQLMENIPEEEWSRAHHYIIYHGRRVCAARNPKCEGCTVAPFCKKHIEDAGESKAKKKAPQGKEKE